MVDATPVAFVSAQRDGRGRSAAVLPVYPGVTTTADVSTAVAYATTVGTERSASWVS